LRLERAVVPSILQETRTSPPTGWRCRATPRSAARSREREGWEGQPRGQPRGQVKKSTKSRRNRRQLQRLTAPSPPSPLSGALPMATPHHHTFPTEEQRRRHPQRSLLRRTQLQRPPAPDSFTQTCMPQPAPCCVAGTKRELATQPLWSWWRANPGSAIARHAHGALLRNG